MAVRYLYDIVLSASFFESASLYQRQKLELELPEQCDSIKASSIQEFCPTCRIERTFAALPIANDGGYINPVRSRSYTLNKVYVIAFKCPGCESLRLYYVFFDTKINRYYKVGQHPESSARIDRDLESVIGPKYAGYMAKGLRCEQFSYGIGAYSYYRRIVEDSIQTLLQELIVFIQETGQQEEYLRRLEEVRESHRGSDKINAVKDLLPDSLRADGMNPLGLLYGVISEGIHSRSDEECLQEAQDIRTVLEHLAHQIKLHREGDGGYKEAMRRLMDRNRANQEE